MELSVQPGDTCSILIQNFLKVVSYDNETLGSREGSLLSFGVPQVGPKVGLRQLLKFSFLSCADDVPDDA
jgi:hypothetical protein